MKTTIRLLSLLWCVFLSIAAAQAQVVTTDPVFPTENGPVTLYFDATKGTGGLKDVPGPLYAHTGVLVNGGSQWTHVKSEWGTASPETRLESLGNNRYKFVIDNPRTFYGVAANEKITALMFVFRNENGTKEGKDTGGADIKVEVHESSALKVSFTEPVVDLNAYFVNANQSISVKGTASESAKLSLLVNGQKVQEVTGTTLSSSIIATQAGTNKVKLMAENGSATAVDSFTFIVRSSVQVQALPAGAKDGITYLSPTSVLLNLYAPEKNSVYVLGDFNNWQVGVTPMYRTPDGTRYWVQIDGLTAQKEYAYQYLIDENLRIADPYAEKILDPSNDQYIPVAVYPNLISYPTGKTTGMASVLQTAQETYNWKVPAFERPKKTDLVIYELHLRDFIQNHDYKTLSDTLTYLSRLGVNAIELMPVNEFEGNSSWGYNVSYYFAPDKYYGTKQMLKQFIDEAHSKGMAVILDMVLNHSFGQSPMVQMYFNSAENKPAANSPWFNQTPTHPYNVGYDFNHESAATKYFVDRVNEFWLKEYHIDGYRFDLTKGFTQQFTDPDVSAWSRYDASRVAILKRMVDHIRTIDANSFVIFEHLADNDEEKELANYGIMLWGNMWGNYKEAILGYDNATSNFNWISYKQRGWNEPNVVGYMESHDEERQVVEALKYGNSTATYNVKNLNTALDRVGLAAAFFFTVPGPKMVWQFGELGYDVSLEENGRTGEKPIRWNYYTEATRKKLYDVYADLIKLRIEQPAFESSNYSLVLSGNMKSIHITDPSMNVTVLGNFGVTSSTITPNFQSTGTWYDYMTGQTLQVANVTSSITLQPGEYRVYTSKQVTSSDVVTGIEDELTARAKELTVYPNPAVSSELMVRYEMTSTSEVSLQLYDQLGKLIRTKSLGKQSIGTQTSKLSLSTATGKRLAPGVYICRLVTGSTIKAVQVVVQ